MEYYHKMNDAIIQTSIKFTGAFKTLKDNGNLVYEYNPFRNYRLSKTMFEYNNGLYEYDELSKTFNIALYKQEKGKWEKVTSDSVTSVITSSELLIVWKKGDNPLDPSDSPIMRRKGELVDFETNELKFDINHPVDIIP